MEIPISLDADARLLTEEEINHALAGLEERHPAWRAIQQLLAVQFAHAVGASTAPRLTEREAGHAAGQIEALLAFRADLKHRRAAQQQQPAPRRK